MGLRKVALHLDISPWLNLLFSEILEHSLALYLIYSFSARYLLLSFME